MTIRPTLLAAAAMSALLPAALHAQTAPARTDPPPSTATSDGDDFHGPEADLVVTAPYVRSLDLFGTVGVVQGTELARDLRGQIGETLARQPGVSATSFTPGASRPVIRGFQGERIRVLTDGIGSIDASNTSADHAVAINSLTAERIEIIRGPASLLFGSNASGGAVNVFDRRIPRALPESPAHIDALASYGSAADERSGAVSIDVPVGTRIALHLDGNYARTNDLRIGGFQSTAALRAQGVVLAADALANGDADLAADITGAVNQRGRLANSATETYGFGGGISLITDGGSLGVSVGLFDSVYGIPSPPGGEGGVTIDLRQWRADVRGEVELGSGLFDRLRLRAGFADYVHQELEGGDVGTTFLNQGIEARAELVQARRGGWSGASGVQFTFRDLTAIGDEAFLPPNESEQFALFTLQEWHLGSFGIELSGRYEQSRVTATDIGFARSFNALSGAFGLSYDLDDNSKLGVTLSSTSRAPSAEELLSNGPHIATQAFEVGDLTLGKELSRSLETFARLRVGAARVNLSAFASWFDGFIIDSPTGAVMDDLPVFQYVQRDARFYGAELEAEVPIAQFGGWTLSSNLTGDVVRARLANGGGNVPRIPPLRLRGGVELDSSQWQLSAEVEWNARQNRIAAFESATDAFTLVNLSATWHPLGRERGVSLILSGNNLFDVVARRHASFTKDFAPLAGRDIRLTARASF